MKRKSKGMEKKLEIHKSRRKQRKEEKRKRKTGKREISIDSKKTNTIGIYKTVRRN